MKAIIGVFFVTIIVIIETHAVDKVDACGKDIAAVVTDTKGACYVFGKGTESKSQPAALGEGLYAGQSLQCEPGGHLKIMFCATRLDKVVTHDPERWYIVPNVPSENPEAEDETKRALREASQTYDQRRYGYGASQSERTSYSESFKDSYKNRYKEGYHEGYEAGYQAGHGDATTKNKRPPHSKD